MNVIREATDKDYDAIQTIYLSAFPDNEKHLVASLACKLLNQETNPNTFSLVAESDNLTVGHIAFSPVIINGQADIKAYIIAPLAVMPNYQNRSIGSALIEHGLKILSNAHVNIVFVYGDPMYYGKFGFNNNVTTNYLAPYPLQQPYGWQARILNEFKLNDSPVEISCVAALEKPELW